MRAACEWKINFWEKRVKRGAKKEEFDSRQTNIWFTSDWHYNHAYFADDVNGERIMPIWKERGYSSCEEMSESIIGETNNAVKENDILIHHGDVALRSTAGEVKELFRRINCKNIYLVWGNHESQTRDIYEEEVKKEFGIEAEIYPLRYNNVIFCGPELDVAIKYGDSKKEKIYIHCAHFPKSIWDNMKRGNCWMTCGHSHLGFYDTLPATIDKGKILDVGWDWKKRPVSFEEVRKVMERKIVVRKDKNH